MKLQAPPDNYSGARLLRNGKVRVLEPAQRKTKQQGATAGRVEPQSNLFATETLQSEDIANVNNMKPGVHFSEEQEHKKLLNLLEEQRSLLQNKTGQKTKENLHDTEKECLEKEKSEKLQADEIRAEMHESEDDEPLSKFLKQEAVLKDQKKMASPEVEDDEPLFNILSKFKSSKKRNKLAETSPSVSRQASASDLTLGPAMQLYSMLESHAAPLEDKATSSGDIMPPSKGDSEMVELPSVDENAAPENESSALKAALSPVDHGSPPGKDIVTVPPGNESSAFRAASSTAGHGAPLGKVTVAEDRSDEPIQREELEVSLTVEDHKVELFITEHQESVREKGINKEASGQSEPQKTFDEQTERTTGKRKNVSEKGINKEASGQLEPQKAFDEETERTSGKRKNMSEQGINQEASGQSKPHKTFVGETERTTGKRKNMSSPASTGRRKIQLDEPLYSGQKEPKLQSLRKSRNIINKHINADSIAGHWIPEVSCSDVIAAQERKLVSDRELKALREELHPLFTERLQDDQKQLTNDFMEKWMKVMCEQMHTSFDVHASIIQHFLCHSQGPCDKQFF